MFLCDSKILNPFHFSGVFFFFFLFMKEKPGGQQIAWSLRQVDRTWPTARLESKRQQLKNMPGTCMCVTKILRRE